MHTPPIFSTVVEARAAISKDNLATIYRTADKVFIATAHGTGTFTRQEWEGSATGSRAIPSRRFALADPPGHGDAD